MMDAAGSSETPVHHIYQATRLHTPKNGYLQDNVLLPTYASVSKGCTLLHPAGGLLLQLAIIPFSEYGNSSSLLDEGSKKARESSFCKKKASFRISRFDSFSLLRQQRDRTWSISLSEPSQQSQHRLFFPLLPSITPTTHPQHQNLRSSSPYISSLGLVREGALTK